MKRLEEKLLATREVAEHMSVNVATVNRWAATGKLSPAVKTPGLRGVNLFRLTDVEALAAKLSASADS